MEGTILKKVISQEVEIKLTGTDIAELFWNLNSVDQAAFFNKLGEESRLVLQLQSVTDEESLSRGGRHAMQRIGEYSDNN